MDVLVCDLSMPEESGFDLIAWLRDRAGPNRAVPAVALSALTREDDRARALSIGFDDHLGKPFVPEELTRTVAELSNRR